MPDSTELEKYLAEVEERANDVTFLRASLEDPANYCWGKTMEVSQADVPSLLKMLRRFSLRHPRPRHTFCTCGPCAHYTLLDRTAREARGAKPEQTLGAEIIEGLTELTEQVATGEPLSDTFRVDAEKNDA